MEKVLIATNNSGKVKELKELLGNLPIELVSLNEVAPGFEVEETGKTFKENAILKARECAERVGLLTIADDSGLEVDALDGNPGVYSARFLGDVAQEEKNQKILEMMRNIPEKKRTARFKVAIAIASPSGHVRTVEGAMEGRIAFESRGANNFGYDPIFIPHLSPIAHPRQDKNLSAKNAGQVPKGFTKTNAELTIEEKNKISHRGKALKKAIKILKGIIYAGY